MFKRLIETPQVRWLVRVLKRLTDAPDSLTNDPLRTRLRIMNGLLLFLTIAVFIGLQMGWFFTTYSTLVVTALGIMFVLYLLSKAGYYNFAVWALSLFLALVPKVVWLLENNGTVTLRSEILVNWTILASVISYFTLTTRQMVMSFAISKVALVFVLILVPLSTTRLGAALFITVTVDILLLIAAHLRGRSEMVIEQQAQTLEQERIRINTLLEAAREAIIMHRNGTILLVNPACEKLFGYCSEELIGMSILELFAEEDRANATTRYEQNDDRPYELKGLHRDGTTLILELAGRSQYFRGERVRVVSLRDISERKVEQQRSFDFALEQEKVRILQKFINDISHDLRTPLSVINTSIYLIEKLASNPQRQQAQIEVLQGQATQVQRLLEDLITMSRLDKADTSDFAYLYLDIQELLTQLVEDCQNDALRKKQRLTFQPAAPPPPRIFADPTQVKRMMRYLILNGVTYTPAGGEIVISTICEPTAVIISVRDSGPGIPEHKLPFIFDQFYRGDEARGGDGGAGLGLTIARKIAQAHSGSITVQSKIGEGSDFRVSLPIPAVSPG